MALGFAVACLHALCGADRAEMRDCVRGGDTFLSGIVQAAEQLARIDEPRKNRVNKCLLRDSRGRDISDATAFIIFEFAKIHAAIFETQKIAFSIGQNKKIFPLPTNRAAFCFRAIERSNPIRAPSAA